MVRDNFRFGMRAFSILASIALSGVASASPVNTEWGRIVSIDTGWSQPYMALEMSFAAINPDNCLWGGGFYTIPPDAAGYETFQSLAMSAYFAGKEVALTIDGCAANRPKIISVKVRG